MWTVWAPTSSVLPEGGLEAGSSNSGRGHRGLLLPQELKLHKQPRPRARFLSRLSLPFLEGSDLLFILCPLNSSRFPAF